MNFFHPASEISGCFKNFSYKADYFISSHHPNNLPIIFLEEVGLYLGLRVSAGFLNWFNCSIFKRILERKKNFPSVSRLVYFETKVSCGLLKFHGL